MRVRLVHWKSEEAGQLLDALRKAGYEVQFDPSADARAVYLACREHPPDLIAIDLSRLPSHGREFAIALRHAKTTRQVPLVFVGGAADKVEAIRRQLPDAVFTPLERIAAAISRAIAHSPANPVLPTKMMDRCRDRSAAQKLGIREGSRVAVIDAPRDYAVVIGKTPPGAQFDEAARATCDVALWFVHDVDGFLSSLRRMRSLAGRSKLWILWPKKSAQPSSGLSEQIIREAVMDLGLVDYKICAVDRTWSALAVAVRKDRR